MINENFLSNLLNPEKDWYPTQPTWNHGMYFNIHKLEQAHNAMWDEFSSSLSLLLLLLITGYEVWNYQSKRQSPEHEYHLYSQGSSLFGL